jgi:F-type H+-transporting ATPase subunit a
LAAFWAVIWLALAPAPVAASEDGGGLSIDEIASHVRDADSFHVPRFVWKWFPEAQRAMWIKAGHHEGHLPLPNYGTMSVLGWKAELKLTKFMALEAVAAVLMILVFVPLGWRISTGRPPQGRCWNLFEAMLVFLRDDVARPAIGRSEADRYLPFIWTLFFFILVCNLLGMVPWAGSPTGALAVTGTLALITLCTVMGAGMAKFGVAGYFGSIVPHMDLPLALAVFLKPMLWGIELGGLLIKHCVLAVRLLANMFAGHLVLAVIVSFIGSTVTAAFVIWVGVTFASVLSAVALSLLELFVAFLQAYVFTFLAALFIGMARHPH